MTTWKSNSPALAAGALSLLLSACSSTVEWDTLTATAEDFKSCLASAESTWRQAETVSLFAAAPDLLADSGDLYPETNAFELLLAQGPAAAASALALPGTGGELAPASVEAALRTLAAGADAAADVVRHPVHKQLARMAEEIRKGAAPTPVAIDLDDASDYVRTVQRAESTDGWAALAQSEMLFAVHGVQAAGGEARSTQRIAQGLRTAIFVKAYLNAYFRGGRVVGLTLNADAVNQLSAILRQDLVDELRSELQAMLDQATSHDMFKLGDVAFVSRGGASRQFPGFSATYAPGLGKPQFSEIPVGDVGADIVRVTLEGFFDSFFGLPAMSNATGVGLTAQVDGTEVPIGLPEFGKLDRPPYKQPFDKEAFEKIDERANSVE